MAANSSVWKIAWVVVGMGALLEHLKVRFHCERIDSLRDSTVARNSNLSDDMRLCESRRRRRLLISRRITYRCHEFKLGLLRVGGDIKERSIYAL